MKRPSKNPLDYSDDTVGRLIWSWFASEGGKPTLSKAKRTKMITACNALTRQFADEVIWSMTKSKVEAYKAERVKAVKTYDKINLQLGILRKITEIPTVKCKLGEEHFMSKVLNVSESSKPSKDIDRLDKLDSKLFEENTVAYALCRHLEQDYYHLAYNTRVTARSSARNIMRYFGIHTCMSELSLEEIKNLRAYYAINDSASTWNKMLPLLREVYARAQEKGLASHDFCHGLKNLPRSESKRKYLYFTKSEVQTIIDTPTEYPLSKIALLVANELGPRGCEIIPLGHEDLYYDDDTGKLFVSISICKSDRSGDFRPVKTSDSERDFPVSTECAELLERAKALSRRYSSVKISVLERSNLRRKDVKRQFLFLNEKTGMPWKDTNDYNQGFLKPFLKKAGIDKKGRGLGIARHTYATHQATRGTPQNELQEQMGHAKGSKVTNKHYNASKPKSVTERLLDAENAIVVSGDLLKRQESSGSTSFFRKALSKIGLKR